MSYKTKFKKKIKVSESGLTRDDNTNKPRYDLLIPEKMSPNMLDRWAALMARGAQNHCQPIPVTSQLLFNEVCDTIGICQKTRESNVDITIEWFTAITCVGLVTKNNYERLTLNLPSGNSKTGNSGAKETKTRLEKLIKDDKQTLTVLKEIKEPSSYSALRLGDLMKKKTHFFLRSKKIDAEYANEVLGQELCILTMIIKQDLQEDIYVLGATQELESLEILLEVLKRQYFTLKIVQPKSFLLENDKLFISNHRNWEKANTQEDLQRFKESAARHFMSWFKGKDDEDHASALFFNVQGVEYIKNRGIIKK